MKPPYMWSMDSQSTIRGKSRLSGGAYRFAPKLTDRW